ncbi:ECF RNA polymerase sigma factor SigE [Thalassoglobus neptunius]|uniref:ECF RNA polymerase sigma factor SigE n=1 Tax=Thalassoglobus neptunius TaxID=1938619 RepID=A0A5C5X2E9_9PLAN|nr:RNA polymerase sigma factor [Thalassoglobus neptunius]TWT56799.1 ECF RNA polymerase sigma factor SigE [Thalassoglobus neptunius]
MQSERSSHLNSVGDLVEDHYADVYRFAYRLSGSHADAEDLTQQAFLTACRKRYQVQDPDRIRGWLLTIVRNTFLKTRQRDERMIAAFEDVAVSSNDFDSDTFRFDEETLQKALNEIPEHYKTPLLLYYFEEIGYKEIGELLGIPIGTVMSRLSRARSVLRERLCRENETSEISETEDSRNNPASEVSAKQKDQ